jgi:hypothetical protein
MTSAPVPTTASRLVSCAPTASSDANGEFGRREGRGRPMAVVAVRWLKELVRRERDVLFFESTSRSTLAFCLSMIFSRNRFVLFQITL